MTLPLPDHMAHYSFQRYEKGALPRWEAHSTNKILHSPVQWEQVPEDVQGIMIACSIMLVPERGAHAVIINNRQCYLWDEKQGVDIWVDD